jgi:hypothetical protein
VSGQKSELTQQHRERPGVTQPLCSPAFSDTCRKLVANHRNALGRDADRTRTALRELLGKIRVAPHASGDYLLAEPRLNKKSLLLAASGSQDFMFARAGFVEYLNEELRLRNPQFLAWQAYQSLPPRFSRKILFDITVNSEATKSTPSVESERQISVALSTTPQIARIDSAVAATILTIATV